jgi:hypothetical protein
MSTITQEERDMVFNIIRDAGIDMSKEQVDKALDKVIELFPDFIALLNSTHPSSEDLLKLSVMPQAMHNIVERELQKLQTEAERLVELSYGLGNEAYYAHSKTLLNRAGELKSSYINELDKLKKRELKSSYMNELDKLKEHIAQQAG